MRDLGERSFWLANEDERKSVEILDMHFWCAVELLLNMNVYPEVDAEFRCLAEAEGTPF